MARVTQLLGSSFPDDDGRADEALSVALGEWDGSDAALVPVLERLRRARLLVPVVAVLGEAETGPGTDGVGLVREKSSDMAVVLLRSSQGRPGLLAFTGTESLAAWDAEARPVPTAAPLAAKAAVQEQAAALLVDIAGPVTLVVTGADLEALAAGWTPALVDGRRCWIGGPPESSVNIVR